MTAASAGIIITSTAGDAAVSVSPAGNTQPLTPEEREYYAMRWRVLLLELRFIADRMGWTDRLPTRKI